MEVSAAEESLVAQVCLDVGYPYQAAGQGGAHARGPNAGAYLAGSREQDPNGAALLHDFPELAHLRDVVFMLKLMMSPTAGEGGGAEWW